MLTEEKNPWKALEWEFLGLLVLVASEGVQECVLAATSRAATVPPTQWGPSTFPRTLPLCQAGAQGCTSKLGESRPSSQSGASHSP